MSPRRLWLGLMLASMMTAQAHRLNLDWEYHDGALLIRARAESEPAAGALVEFRSADGSVLETGTLDAEGRYRWTSGGAAPVTIEVNAGLGHRRTLTLSAHDLRPNAAAGITPPGQHPVDTPAAPGPATRASGTSDAAFSTPVRVGLGLTFLLALTAAWTSLRNARRLNALERRWHLHEGGS
jgi:hypothetical protein